MKAKFNKLLANFEREEKPENGTDLGSQVGTAYFNSQENGHVGKRAIILSNHQETKDTEDGNEEDRSPDLYGDEEASD